jgi:hypothetical protein
MPRPHAQLVCLQVTGQQQCALGTARFVVVALAFTDHQGFPSGSRAHSRHWAPYSRDGERSTFLAR